MSRFLVSNKLLQDQFFGNRQGYRSDLEKVKKQTVLYKKRNSMPKSEKKSQLMNKDAQVTQKKSMPVRQLIANCLGFGRPISYP